MKKLYSASKIADMRLPGLPTTKPAVIARAASEGWYSEERTGLGGKRRVYEIPSRYLGSSDEPSSPADRTPQVPTEAEIVKVREHASAIGMNVELFERCLAAVGRFIELHNADDAFTVEMEADFASTLYRYFLKRPDITEDQLLTYLERFWQKTGQHSA